MMQVFEFTDAEIAAVCMELDIPKDSFSDKNSERRKIIDCWGNANIIACPGSGKTTVLLVKLLLLAKRMPLSNGKGICILTHTNIAIDEIRERLKDQGDVLFKHPNYFGTIQGFVNKFLALPFHARYSQVGRALVIGDSQYIKLVDRELLLHFKNKKSEIYNNVTNLMLSNENLKYGYRLKNEYGGAVKIVNKLNGDEYTPKRPKKKKQKEYIDYSHDEKKNILECLIDIKRSILKKGFIHYDDAYYLAKIFLEKFNVSELISTRFPFLFVDEAQDTQEHQMGILSTAFGSTVVKQYYGDPDQAIFSNTIGGISAWDVNQKTFIKLNISDSKRYGSRISECINPFKRELANVVGNENVASQNPCIILYDNPKDVLPLFLAEIRRRSLFDLDEYKNWKRASSPFNAVGFVGKESENITIHSYSNNYSKTSRSIKNYFSSLISYFQKRSANEIKKNGVNVYYELFISALVHVINEAGEHHSQASLLAKLSEDNEDFLKLFKFFAYKWIVDIEYRFVNAKIIRDEFLALFKVLKSDHKPSIFTTGDTMQISEQVEFKTNYYSADGIDIKLGTIHSVKGETHLATLLFDTQSNREFESSYFFKKDCGKLFCGKDYNRPVSYKQLEYRLKTTYVAMSRPTHLLCVALKRENTDCPTCAGVLKESCNWEIIYASKNE